MKEITLFGGEHTGCKLKVKEGVDKVAVQQKVMETPLLSKLYESGVCKSQLDCSYYVKANLVFREVVGAKPSGCVYKELVIDNIYVPESDKHVYEKNLADILIHALNAEWEVKWS